MLIFKLSPEKLENQDQMGKGNARMNGRCLGVRGKRACLSSDLLLGILDTIAKNIETMVCTHTLECEDIGVFALGAISGLEYSPFWKLISGQVNFIIPIVSLYGSVRKYCLAASEFKSKGLVQEAGGDFALTEGRVF
jgi:hypothetical protein